MKYRISASVVRNGFDIRVNGKTYPVRYPTAVWRSFPAELHEQFAQTIAFVATMHLSFPKNNTILYLFPSPVNEAFFSYGLLFAMSENLLEYKTAKTTDYLRIVLNSYYRRTFTGHALPMQAASYVPRKNTAVVPFSFGKDSLLTLGLCKELGISTLPVFFLEPSNTLENNNKRRLIREFKKTEGISVTTIDVPQADLRGTGGFHWGWDNFLTHYTLLLLPYMYANRASYFFWSNEYNREMTSVDSEGFVAHQTFEQSSRWLQMLEVALRAFGAPVRVASILERLPEFSVLKLLHTRYPKLGAYQLSCLNDAPSSATKRWCGNCYECAKSFIYFSALGIDPARVELRDNMLAEKNRKHFYIFSSKDFHNAFAFNRDEHLLAFWLSGKNGARGPLLDEFLSRYKALTQKNEAAWRRRYFSLYPAVNTPEELRRPLEKIFLSVRGGPVPGGKSVARGL